MIAGRVVFLICLAGLMGFMPVEIAWSQSNSYEGGRILRVDERSEDIEMGMTGSSYDDEEEEEVSLPWIPVFSPVMICLDCWMTKTYKIWDFYHQQAAQEYFAHSESCADLVLCPDPCVGTALKYTLLAPIYAMRPHLLLRNCRACGISNPYGVPDPMPSVAMPTPTGPQVVQPATPMMPMEAPDAMPESLPPPPVAVPPISQTQTGQTASAPSWSGMNDEQILQHYGLQGTMLNNPLETPTSASNQWEFADQAPSLPASELIANSATVQVKPVSTKPVTASQESEIKLTAKEEKMLKNSTVQKSFSVTDEEYDRMKDIEKSLLSGANRD
jgi:hypothetical protein